MIVLTTLWKVVQFNTMIRAFWFFFAFVIAKFLIRIPTNVAFRLDRFYKFIASWNGSKISTLVDNYCFYSHELLNIKPTHLADFMYALCTYCNSLLIHNFICNQLGCYKWNIFSFIQYWLFTKLKTIYHWHFCPPILLKALWKHNHFNFYLIFLIVT